MTALAIVTAVFNSLWQAAALAGLVWLAMKTDPESTPRPGT